MPDRFPTLNEVRRALNGAPSRTAPRAWKDRRYDDRRSMDPALALAARVRNSSRWQEARALVLARTPLCAWCLAKGLTTQADEVDHVLGLAVRPDLAFHLENLQALCHPCHAKKEAKVRAQDRARMKKATPAPAAPTATTPAALAQQRAAAGLRTLEGQLGRLEVKPGDVLVLTSARVLAPSTVERLKNTLAVVFPGHPVIVLDEGVELGAVTPAASRGTTS